MNGLPRPSRSAGLSGRAIGLGLLAVLLLGGGTTVSYFVDALWFSSLGFGDVFWTTLKSQGRIFVVFFGATFILLYVTLLALKPARLADLATPILINGQPFRLPVEPVLRLIALVAALFIAGVTGLRMMASWATFALYWNGAGTAGAVAATPDPIFGRPLSFYFFTLPVWHLLAGWMTTLAVLVLLASAFVAAMTGGARLLSRPMAAGSSPVLRGVSLAFAWVLASFAVQAYIARFDRLLADHTIFAGVTYVDAYVEIPGLLILAGALLLGAAAAVVNAVAAPKVRWLVAACVPAVVAYVGMTLVAWYVGGFIVKPNELVRERPFITHNIAMTQRAFGLDRIEVVPFPADPGVEAVEADRNRETLEDIRLWDWRALQDTLRQIQEIRTYYDFPDIDIDRYEVDGVVRQMMLAVRELNVERLPESSRNWINEKLIYTHGYGATMNRVNTFTAEGTPDLLLGDMPVKNKVPSIRLTRPEVYFGELTNTDVYVKTKQREFNYPEGDTNSETTYEGTGGIEMGGLLRRLLISLDRGDITKVPFSDDITAESRLLMRRNINARVQALAPFLTFDADPYIVITDAGRMMWMLDGFTTSAMYPYARHYRIGNQPVNYMRNSVKATVDAYDGAVSFYVFDADDPIAAAYRGVFPSLFQDASAMPADLRRHVRYPELLIEMQSLVYGLYHMSQPDVFYNREDLWTVATAVGGTDDRREAGPQPMEANFVLMKLPGEDSTEFVEILPFTPANRNNLIGWIAGRSDGEHYGKTIVYTFPTTRLVDGPLQIEARIDQNAQLSGQLSLWNQQGSTVRRGSLIVIPVGRALLYAQPIYLQATRSPMPELRIVVLALQDKFAYGPTFESAMASLFGGVPSSLTLPTTPQPTASSGPSATATTMPAPGTTTAPGDRDTLIAGAARDLADYQRLTAEGRLGEAGQRLEALKQKLEQLQR